MRDSRYRLWLVRSAAPIGALVPAVARAITWSVQTVPVMFDTDNPVAAAPATATASVDVGCTCQALVDCVAFTYRAVSAVVSDGCTTVGTVARSITVRCDREVPHRMEQRTIATGGDASRQTAAVIITY